MAEVVKAHCNRRLGERRHEVLHSVEDRWEDEVQPGMTIWGTNEYEMLRCCGCEAIALRHKSWNSESMGDYGEPEVKTVYYPSALSRSEPAGLDQLKWPVKSQPADSVMVAELLIEIYAALQNDSPRLAAMGIRALLEGVMVAKVGDQGSFVKNLEAFRDAGYISPAQATVLDPILEAGHATIHRAYKPSVDTVNTLIDIAESVIAAVYIHPGQVDEIKGKIPPRKRSP